MTCSCHLGQRRAEGRAEGGRWKWYKMETKASSPVCLYFDRPRRYLLRTTVPVTNPVQGGGVRLQDKANRECFPLPWREASRHLGSMHTMAMALMTLDGHAACSSARPAARNATRRYKCHSTLSWHSLSTTRLRSESPLAISPVHGFPESRTPEHTS